MHSIRLLRLVITIKEMSVKTIYKYKLALTDQQIINIPADAEILSIQEQAGDICMWVKLDTDKPERARSIVICGTGNPVDHLCDMHHISTLQMGNMVWHFFEL